MGLLKKKEVKKEPVPPLPIMELDLVMHNTTTLTADEESDFCSALFQTDVPLSPAEWQFLALKASEGVRFVMRLVEVVPDENGKG